MLNWPKILEINLTYDILFFFYIAGFNLPKYLD